MSNVDDRTVDLHYDPTAGQYLKSAMDAVFGAETSAARTPGTSGVKSNRGPCVLPCLPG